MKTLTKKQLMKILSSEIIPNLKIIWVNEKGVRSKYTYSPQEYISQFLIPKIKEVKNAPKITKDIRENFNYVYSNYVKMWDYYNKNLNPKN